jgi:hypothetical protein
MVHTTRGVKCFVAMARAAFVGQTLYFSSLNECPIGGTVLAYGDVGIHVARAAAALPAAVARGGVGAVRCCPS